MGRMSVLIFLTALAAVNAGHIGAPATYAPGPSIQAASIAHQVSYATPIAQQVSYAAPIAQQVSYAAPIAHQLPYAAPIAHQTVMYSAAPAVSHSYFRQATSSLKYAAPAVAVAPAVHAIHAAPAINTIATHAIATPAIQTHAVASPAVAYGNYGYAPAAIHAPAIGTSTQSVVRSLGGNSAISHYSKAVDSAFSSVRKYDTRITNDGIAVAPAVIAHHAPAAYETYAHAYPAVAGTPIAHTTFTGFGTHYAF